jgi:glutathione S-transferase
MDLDVHLVKHMVDLMRDTGGMVEQINPAKLSGDRFGLADATLLPYVLRVEHLGMDPVLDASQRPRLADWLSRVKGLACYATAVEAWAPLAIVEMMRTNGKEDWDEVEPLTRRAAV